MCNLFGGKVSTVVSDFLTQRHAVILKHCYTCSETHMHYIDTGFEEAALCLWGQTQMWFIICNLLYILCKLVKSSSCSHYDDFG